MWYSSLWTLTLWCLLMSSYSGTVQYNTGTIITTEEVVNIGMVKLNMIIHIPQIQTLDDIVYIRPCDMIHQFSADLQKANVASSTGLINQFTHMCKDYARLKRLNLGVKNYYLGQINKAELSMSAMTETKKKRSILSFIRHGLNIGDYHTQLEIRKKLGALQEDQFNTKGNLDKLQYRITHHSDRLRNLEQATVHANDMIDHIDRYLTQVSDNINGKDIINRYNHVMVQDVLNSGIITNQYLNIATRIIEGRIKSLTDLAKHYLPYDLVSAHELKNLLTKFQVALSTEHPSLQLVHQTIHDYYSIDNVHGIVRNKTFYVQIPLLLNFKDQDYTVYKLTPFYLPIPGNDAAMKLQHKPRIAVNHRLRTYFVPSENDLKDCVGEQRKVCSNSLPTIKHIDSSQSKPCELSIVLNKTELIKENCDIGVKPLPDISPDILQVDFNRVLVINPHRHNVYQQCDNSKSRKLVSAELLVETTVQCFCWLSSEEMVSPTFIYEGCIQTVETEVYNPSQNI